MQRTWPARLWCSRSSCTTCALRQLQSPEHLLRELLEVLMGEDLLRLSRLEEKLEELEGSMEKADPNTFLRALARYRRKLSQLGAYYTQLTAAGEQFQEGGEEELWEKFIAHAQRLQDHVGLLREDLLQLRICGSSRWPP